MAHDFAVARRHAPIVGEVRRLNLSFHLSRQEINSYMPWNESQWKDLWRALGGLASLREVKLWLDGRLGPDLHDLQLKGPALFQCLGEGEGDAPLPPPRPRYALAVSLPTDEATEDALALTDPWGPRYGMDYFRDVELQFRGAPAYRPSDKKGVCGPANSAAPSLEVMAWYSMSMNI